MSDRAPLEAAQLAWAVALLDAMDKLAPHGTLFLHADGWCADVRVRNALAEARAEEAKLEGVGK